MTSEIRESFWRAVKDELINRHGMRPLIADAAIRYWREKIDSTLTDTSRTVVNAVANTVAGDNPI